MEIVAANPVLAVHDLQVSAEWYRQVLACEATEVDPGNWVFCRSGSIQFMLGRCPDIPPASEIGDHSYVAYLEVDDIHAYYARGDDGGSLGHPPVGVLPARSSAYSLMMSRVPLV